jgi:hypothetical protein
MAVPTISSERHVRSTFPWEAIAPITPEIRYPLSETRLMVGQLVRVGPRHISVQGVEAIQAIYGVNTKWKKPFRTPNDGFPQIVSHGVLHLPPALNDVKCRRILEPSFSAKAVAQQQHILLNCADTALTVTEIACESDAGKVDILQIARTYAFDVISLIHFCTS